MATYLFKCESCSNDLEITIPITEELKPPNCEICNKEMIRDYESEFSTHSVAVKKDKLQPLNCGRHAEDWKKAKAAKIDAAIADEPIESMGEMQEGKGLAAQLEKDRGLAPNTILGGRETPKNKEEKESIARRDLVKKEASIKARRKMGL